MKISTNEKAVFAVYIFVSAVFTVLITAENVEMVGNPVQPRISSWDWILIVTKSLETSANGITHTVESDINGTRNLNVWKISLPADNLYVNLYSMFSQSISSIKSQKFVPPSKEETLFQMKRTGYGNSGKHVLHLLEILRTLLQNTHYLTLAELLTQLKAIVEEVDSRNYDAINLNSTEFDIVSTTASQNPAVITDIIEVENVNSVSLSRQKRQAARLENSTFLSESNITINSENVNSSEFGQEINFTDTEDTKSVTFVTISSVNNTETNTIFGTASLKNESGSTNVSVIFIEHTDFQQESSTETSNSVATEITIPSPAFTPTVLVTSSSKFDSISKNTGPLKTEDVPQNTGTSTIDSASGNVTEVDFSTVSDSTSEILSIRDQNIINVTESPLFRNNSVNTQLFEISSNPETHTFTTIVVVTSNLSADSDSTTANSSTEQIPALQLGMDSSTAHEIPLLETRGTSEHLTNETTVNDFNSSTNVTQQIPDIPTNAPTSENVKTRADLISTNPDVTLATDIIGLENVLSNTSESTELIKSFSTTDRSIHEIAVENTTFEIDTATFSHNLANKKILAQQQQPITNENVTENDGLHLITTENFTPTEDSHSSVSTTTQTLNDTEFIAVSELSIDNSSNYPFTNGSKEFSVNKSSENMNFNTSMPILHSDKNGTTSVKTKVPKITIQEAIKNRFQTRKHGKGKSNVKGSRTKTRKGRKFENGDENATLSLDYDLLIDSNETMTSNNQSKRHSIIFGPISEDEAPVIEMDMCKAAWQCNVALNERCITIGTRKICDCGRAFERDFPSGICELVRLETCVNKEQTYCSPNAECVQDSTNSSGYYCACQKNYIDVSPVIALYPGEQCEARTSCEGLCKNNGVCVQKDGDAFCSCAIGYTGDQCEIFILNTPLWVAGGIMTALLLCSLASIIFALCVRKCGRFSFKANHKSVDARTLSVRPVLDRSFLSA